MPVRASAFFCDSIHQEMNGKFILVGVFNGIVQTDAPEYDDNPSLFVSFSDLPVGESKVDLKLVNPEGKRSVNTFELEVSDSVASVNLQIVGIPFRTSRSGSFVMFWKLPDVKKWTPLAAVSVELSVDLENGKEQDLAVGS